MSEPRTTESVPRGVDPSTPNVARMYDYYLGGKDNYAADRETAEKVLARYPELRMVTQQGRAFLDRVVTFLAAEAGIRQFLDIGSGLPTQRNVHEVAHEVDPDARVVYVDYDRIVIVHARALLADGKRGRTVVVEADLRDPHAILEHPDTRTVIDFSRPVAILLSAILHFVPDEDDPYGVVETLVSAMAPGSYLVISHAGGEDMSDRAREAAAEYRGATAQMALRSRSEILRFFDRLELVEPEWRNASPPPAALADQIAKAAYVGVARKP